MYRRGDVVIIDFPHSDLITSKLRPALLVQDLSVAFDMRQALFAMISTVPRIGPTRIPVPLDSEEGRAMGLKHDSVVHCDVIHAIELRLASQPVGHCPLMARVDAALLVAFGLRGV